MVEYETMGEVGQNFPVGHANQDNRKGCQYGDIFSPPHVYQALRHSRWWDQVFWDEMLHKELTI
jgi:hypothetical protein